MGRPRRAQGSRASPGCHSDRATSQVASLVVATIGDVCGALLFGWQVRAPLQVAPVVVLSRPRA
eukprot:873613-Lingulodinium_polyedra.AAC.1